MLYERMHTESLRLEVEINTILSHLKHLPAGDFSCSRNGQYYKWYLNNGQNQIYLSKENQTLAEQLAYKKYLLLKLDELTQKKKLADSYLKQYSSIPKKSEQLLSKNAEYQRLISPFYQPLSQEHTDWMHAVYEKNPKHPEQLLLKTPSGNVVRSKSEVMIDYSLYTHNIPFRYESPLYLNQTTIYPDFTILHPVTGKMFFWEHFGLMDDSSYRKTVSAKLNLYISNGIIPSIHLITTYETKENPLTSEIIENIVQLYFL